MSAQVWITYLVLSAKPFCLNFEQSLYICPLPSLMGIQSESGIFANGLDDNKYNLDIIFIIEASELI